MNDQYTSKSKKKIYTELKEGINYNAFWSGYHCWVKDETGKVIYRFDTSIGLKGKAKVIVKYKIPYAYIYEKN